MRTKLFTILTGIIAMMMVGCGSDETSRDDLPPTKPQWVARTPDNVYPQRGIRPVPVPSGTATFYQVILEWYANPEPDVVKYRIWRMAEFETEEYRRYVVKDLTVGSDIEEGLNIYAWVDKGDSTIITPPLRLLDPDPETGQSRGYYWTIEAVDEAGNRSQLSDPIYYRMINAPFNVHADRTADSTYTLFWEYVSNPDVSLSYYMIRVYPSAWGPDSVVWYQQAQRYGTHESVIMDFRASGSPIMADCTYVCQLNAVAERPSPELHTDSLAGSAASTTFIFRH